MTDSEKYQEYLDLVNKINHHSYLYYSLSEPKIPDSEYDELYQKLIEIEVKNPNWIKNDSPSRRVGGPLLDKFDQHEHKIPMLSLQNAFDLSEIENFYKRIQNILGKEYKDNEEIELFSELKFDGLAISLIYESGVFTRGVTRGNGKKGEDVTENLRTIKNIPLSLAKNDSCKWPSVLEVRGEIFMNHDNFMKLNEERKSLNEPLFANPRNAAAGSLKLLDSSVTAKRKLESVIYQVARWSAKGDDSKMGPSGKKVPGKPRDQEKMLGTLRKLGFTTPEFYQKGKISDIQNFYLRWQEERSSLCYDVDGIVVKVNNFELREILGSTNKNPRWAIAWKFEAKKGITVLESVEFQVGKSGILTPVANLKPITIGGVWVKRSTLHNLGELKRLDIQINDLVEVKRAGDVIPKIDKVIVEKRKSGSRSPVNIPKTCPECNHRLKTSEDEIFLYCPNSECIGIKKERLIFFVSKNGLEMDGLGVQWVLKFLEKGLIRDGADLFALKTENILDLERIKEKLAKNLISAIQKKREVPLEIMIRSLGIPGTGDVTARIISDHFKTLDNLQRAAREELEEIHEVGPKTALNIVTFFSDKKNKNFLDRLFKNGFRIISSQDSDGQFDTPTQSKDNPFLDKKVVFTGTLREYKREEAEKWIRKLGGKTSSSISIKTDFVVYGENAGGKLDKAGKLDIATMSESEFLKILNKLIK